MLLHFLITISCLFSIQISTGLPMVSDDRLCGFQHTDDYFRSGNGTHIDEFPWMAALVYKFIIDDTKAILCSGSVINNRYVLTAAQCLTHPKESVLVGVRLGEYHVKNSTDCMPVTLVADHHDLQCTKTEDFGIEEQIIHPEYERQTRANDIALLRLDRGVTYSDYIRPICLFSAGSRVDDVLQASGWGRSFYNGPTSHLKKKISTTVISNEKCSEKFRAEVISENHLCTQDSNNEFICQGDAGAPIMFVTGRAPQWQLEGIASWGEHCGPGRIGVHTKVSKYLNWIQENIFP